MAIRGRQWWACGEGSRSLARHSGEGLWLSGLTRGRAECGARMRWHPTEERRQWRGVESRVMMQDGNGDGAALRDG
jgi:hypothetical protein